MPNICSRPKAEPEKEKGGRLSGRLGKQSQKKQNGHLRNLENLVVL